MQWIAVADKKPALEVVCWVSNNKYYAHDIRQARYVPSYDVWIECALGQYQGACLDVTHYIEQPSIPRPKCNSN